ncbi:MAG: Ig-like domain-containing protein [Actinomycetota bacterium]
MRALSRISTVVLLVAASLTATGVAAHPIKVPSTLTDRRPIQAGPVDPGFSIDYLGVVWDVAGADHDHAGFNGEVRFRADGVWGPWTRLIEDGAEARGQWASGLVAAHDADAYQIRGIPDDAVRPRAVVLNTTDGPLVTRGTQPARTAGAISRCLSRADWGADESLRFDSGGNEIWPAEFFDVQVMTAHHTATDNDDPDPEATVRAIYEYHAIDRGWGDIGYQYLIDEDGRTYEGRWSGTASSSCESAGGDGRDFAHESTADAARVVTGAHVGGYNSGNLGIALLGEFTTHPRFGGEPKQAAVDSLIDVMAELAVRHGLDPEAVVNYENPHPDSDATKVVDLISGHRDWVSTECPGENLYGDLPDIRQAVAAEMGMPDAAITSPADGVTVSDTVTVTVEATDDVGIARVEFFVDESSIWVDADGLDGWSADWDTTAVSDGGHALGATATDTDGNAASDGISVTVANSTGETMHVDDLDGSSTSEGPTWTALVTVTVLDSSGNPVADATVSGTWSEGASGTSSCLTGAGGQCSVTRPDVPKRTSSVMFTVDDVTGALLYDATANTDPDGDSDGTSILVSKP